MISLVIIFLSYLLGCASTIALSVYLYIHYGLGSPETIPEKKQYQTFHPLPENDQSKNSTVDVVNYLFQFLFQEMKDTSKIRRYVTKKLKIEFDELKNTRIGKLFLQDIIIESFSLGKECLIFNDIQFERQERDERHLIKEFVAKLYADYKDGFSVTLDIKLSFNQTCQLYIKVKRIQGQLRLEFRREPFSHWLLVFQDEPLIDLEIKSYISTRESSELAQIIGQQIRHSIRRKQIWPSYKIRYQPFFPTSKQPSSIDISSVINKNLIPGKFHIVIQYCDRLSIPFEIYDKEKSSLLFIFLTININKQMCKDYLRMNRNQWIQKQIQFIPHMHKISIKEVLYMDKTEILIEELDPLPDGIDDVVAFQTALEDKHVFLLQIQGEEIKTLKQTNCLLDKQNEQKIQILIGIPLLHSVKVHRVVETDKTDGESSNTVGQRITDDSIEQQKNTSTDMVNLIMMDADFLQEFQAQCTLTHKAEAYAEINHKFEFQTGPDEEFLNICLWCKPPLDCDVPNVGKQLILLGYTTVALSEIVLDAHMSFKRETQMTLNFQSANSSKSNITGYTKDPKKKNLAELSTHKKYDDNMAHGFVTINIRHEPEIETKLNQEIKKERASSFETITIQSEQLTSVNEEHELPSSKPSDHIFEDQAFSVGILLCSYCNRTVWMTTGRQCRNCLKIVHKKCEEKFSNKNICTISEDNNNSVDDTDSISNTNQTTGSRFTKTLAAVTAFSVLDSTARRSFRGFVNRNANQISTSPQSELSKNDEDNNSSPYTEKQGIHNLSNQASSILANAASTAYNKLLEFKTKRLALPTTLETRKPRSFSVASENISEDDLQDILTKYLSDENIDFKSLENLFHEKAVDHKAFYAKANELGAELFRDLTLEQRKQRLDSEISRLQQELDLQDRIRDEMFVEYNSDMTDENTKRKIQARIANVEEKVQALAALTILYCSGLKHCCSQMEAKGDNHNMDSKSLDEN